MKKLMITLIVAGMMATSFAATPPATSFANGAGTENAPYEISSVAELLFMRDMTNDSEDVANYRTAHYVLTANLDMASENDWIPIANTASFQGKFDGNGHEIKNLKYGASSSYSSAAGNYVGFIGWVKYGSISNLKIVDAAFYATVTSGDYFLGGVVGYLQTGLVNNCSFSGMLISNQPNSAICYIGGIIGRINSPNEVQSAVVVNCTSTGTISGNFIGDTPSNMLVGGIVGHSAGSTSTTFNTKIVNCYSSMNVSAVSTSGAIYAGGLVGQFATGTSITARLLNSYASGNVYGKTTGNTYVGGIVGRQNSATSATSYCIALNNSVKLEKNSDCFRVASLNNGVLSNNFALGSDVMILQKMNSSLVWINVVVTSNAAGAHGETLAGETVVDQISGALAKLNAYVTANPTVDDISLKSWEIKSGNDFPVFQTSITTIKNSVQDFVDYKIMSRENGIEIYSPALSKAVIYNTNGQILNQINTNNERAFAELSEKGLVVVVGYDLQGRKLFAHKHVVK